MWRGAQEEGTAGDRIKKTESIKSALVAASGGRKRANTNGSAEASSKRVKTGDASQEAGGAPAAAPKRSVIILSLCLIWQLSQSLKRSPAIQLYVFYTACLLCLLRRICSR